ncbi:single-stranded DNA-binding protein [Candidatus Dependentiae bacterium]|nr:single-stranded DNA-binding protein [Candidatus Dependentiae bacterium]
MAGYNRIIMVGNLTKDPDYKQLGNGQVCRLSIASNRSFKNRQTGMLVQEVCYVDVDVWGPQAETCRQYLAKGRAVLVEGRLKLDTWQDAQGANRSKHSIAADRVVFLANNSQAGLDATDNVGGDMHDSMQSSMSAASYTTQNTPEFAKIEQAVAKKQAAKKVAVGSKKELGETQIVPEFKDEPPFEEELPF